MTIESQSALVWAEILVTDLDAATAFYAAITGRGLTRVQMGPNAVSIFEYGDGAVSANLMEGTPAVGDGGTIVHLAAKGTIEDMMGRVTAAGGTVQGDPVSMPFGRYIYVSDPDGNTIGLFERA
ncbi:MAG: VOC family protein [Planktomarina sp.]